MTYIQVQPNAKIYYYFDQEMNQQETKSLSELQFMGLRSVHLQVNTCLALDLRLINNPWVHYIPNFSFCNTSNGLGFVHRFCIICGKNRFESDSDFSNANLNWDQSTYRCKDCDDEFDSDLHQAIIDKKNPQRIKQIFDTAKQDCRYF